jgi:hypothetical protein
MTRLAKLLDQVEAQHRELLGLTNRIEMLREQIRRDWRGQ